MSRTSTQTLNLAIVGAAGRGKSFRLACEALAPRVRIHAICDVNADKLDEAKQQLSADTAYTDYIEMLEKSDVDAVVLGTPMHFHVPQSIEALKRNKHVISEVTAGVSIDECRDLVQAAAASTGIYMMAENYTYTKNNQVVREMVRQGVFGKTYYAEGEYIHELKELNEVTVWRRRWQTGVNGITYGTHSLGPILQWMPGDRVTKVCCAGSGRRHVDPRGDAYENEASCVMLCKTRDDALIKIRVDMLSDRPSAMNNHQLQGIDGCFESGRAKGEPGKIWLRSFSQGHQWNNIEDFYEMFMPENWRRFEELAKKAGHGGGDLLEMIDFVDAIEGVRPTPIGIHEAMDMTLPGLVSQRSIEQGGQWLDVPDSRDWV